MYTTKLSLVVPPWFRTKGTIFTFIFHHYFMLSSFFFSCSSFIAPLYIFLLRKYWLIRIFSKSFACGYFFTINVILRDSWYTVAFLSNSVCCWTRMLMLFDVIWANTRKQIHITYANRLRLCFWASNVHFCKGKVNTLMGMSIKSLWFRPGRK